MALETIARDNISARERKVVDRHSAVIARLLDECIPLVDTVNRMNPEDLAVRDQSDIFQKIRTYSEQAAEELRSITTELRSASNPLNLIKPVVSSRLRHLTLWEDREEEIITKAVVPMALEGRAEKVIPSSEMFRTHYLEPVCRNAGIVPEEERGTERMEALGQKILGKEFTYHDNGYFHGIYFWNGSDWSIERRQMYMDEVKGDIIKAILDRFRSKDFWMRRGHIKNCVLGILGDRWNFEDGQKGETFIKHCTDNTGEILKSSYKFTIASGARIPGLMPRLSRADTERFTMRMAQEEFMGKFSTQRYLTKDHAVSACLNHSIPDARVAYKVDKIEPSADAMLTALQAKEMIRRVPGTETYEIHQRSGRIGPDFY